MAEPTAPEIKSVPKPEPMKPKIENATLLQIKEHELDDSPKNLAREGVDIVADNPKLAPDILRAIVRGKGLLESKAEDYLAKNDPESKSIGLEMKERALKIRLGKLARGGADKNSDQIKKLDIELVKIQEARSKLISENPQLPGSHFDELCQLFGVQDISQIHDKIAEGFNNKTKRSQLQDMLEKNGAPEEVRDGVKRVYGNEKVKKTAITAGLLAVLVSWLAIKSQKQERR